MRTTKKADDKKDKDKEEIKPVEIELENMEARSYRVPIKRGQFFTLQLTIRTI